MMHSRSVWLIAAATTLAGLVVIAAIWLAMRSDEGVGEPPEIGGRIDLPTADLVDLVRLKNVGLAALENGQLDEAVRLFDDLAQQLPAERLPRRNRLVARVLMLESAEVRDGAAQSAEAALREARDAGDAGWATHVLAARIAAGRNQWSRAVNELRQATQERDREAATWFELYRTANRAADSQIKVEAAGALERACQLSPENLVLLIEQLQVQAAMEDGRIVETLQRGEPRWRQLQPGVRQRTGMDLAELIEAARSAAVGADWAAVRRTSQLLRNLTVAEEAVLSDRRRVERHALEFVLEDFSPELMARVPAFAALEAGAWPRFVRPEASWEFPTGGGSVEQVVVADFDLDRQLEVLLLREGSLEVLGRTPGGWRRELARTVPAGLRRLLAVDLDDDVDAAPPEARGDGDSPPSCHRADLDIVLFGPTGVLVLENRRRVDEAGRELVDVELPNGLQTTADVRNVIAADVDVDGDLDLVLLAAGTIQLKSNLGGFRFSEPLPVTGLPEGIEFTAALPIDVDDDLDPDLVVGGEGGEVGVVENLRHQEFQWRSLSPSNGAPVRSIEAVDVGGTWQLILAGPRGIETASARGATSATADALARESCFEDHCDGLITEDLDNDGWRDLVAWSDDGLTILAGQTEGGFSIVDPFIESAPTGCAGLIAADVDGDGQQDLVLAGNDGARWLRNPGSPERSWLDASLVAVQVKGTDAAASGRVNHYGIGSILEVQDGTRRQRLIVRGPVTHFGLGQTPQVDVLRVEWTNGVPANVIHPVSRTWICEKQSLKGSCPYVYGWDGEQFTFITDCLWASPIGLIGADGRPAASRPWEFLKIAAHQLQPRQGRYELRLTEELWEAAYFDVVQLVAVDHPEDVEVFTNEKVGPPALADHRLHAVRSRRVPVSAVDQHGRDVLSLIREEDDRYVRLFDRKLRQGYTEPTSLELDLGDLQDPETITLFLTGWIYPTDTTINAALAEDPRLDGPKPPSVWTPDGQGQWREVLPFMGFPGGKTKTIAVDLSGLFPARDYRVRIDTSCELYWDAVFFAVDESPVELRETKLPLLRAELRTRGVSRPVPHPQHGPERYDYHDVSPSPWRPMAGRLTRLGDVRDLLAVADDQLVVMGSGDEIVLEFGLPDAPPAGWIRDFVLHQVGWDKDADLHTVYGQTIEPLPLRGMSCYPPLPQEQRLDDPVYRQYLDSCQSRTMTNRR